MQCEDLQAHPFLFNETNVKLVFFIKRLVLPNMAKILDKNSIRSKYQPE